MNYFNLSVSDDGSEILFEGDPLFIIRSAGQAVADNIESANVLIGIIAQALYCKNQISETQLDEIINCIDDAPIANFETLEDIWWEQEEDI